MRRTVILLLLASSSAGQALQWQETTLVRSAVAKNEKIEATYSFTNNTTNTVRILSVTTSCGCTAGKPQKQEYVPGEKGSLLVSHDPEGRTGTRSYRITVNTDESGRNADELTLQVSVARQIEAGVRVAVWEAGEPRSAKTIPFKVDSSSPVSVLGAEPERDIINVEVIEGPSPAEKLLKITPKDSTMPGQTRVRLITDPALYDSLGGLFFAVLR
jgi:hypothetical protein